MDIPKYIPPANSRPGTPIWDKRRAGLVLPWVWCKSSSKRSWLEVTLPEDFLKHNKEIANNMISKSWVTKVDTNMTSNPWTGTPTEIIIFELNLDNEEIPKSLIAYEGCPKSIGLKGLFEILKI